LVIANTAGLSPKAPPGMHKRVLGMAGGTLCSAKRLVAATIFRQAGCPAGLQGRSPLHPLDPDIALSGVLMQGGWDHSFG
jgi:hypothetical protein